MRNIINNFITAANMNSTAPTIGQKQTGRLAENRMANTMPADMKQGAGKRAPTATTSKAVGKY